MRIASSLVAFIFLGAAVAGVVPDIAGRNVAVAGGKGGHSASVSGVHLHASGSPTGASVHSIPSSITSHSPASRRAANPSYVHSVHPISRRDNPTGSHSHPSGSPTGASDYPTLSTVALQPHHSGTPSGASDYPTPSDVHALESGLPSGVSSHPKPTASYA